MKTVMFTNRVGAQATGSLRMLLLLVLLTVFRAGAAEVRLPELEPEAAVQRLARMQRDHRILDKDIVALDLRVPGRVEVQLSNEAASARLDNLSRKTKGKV